MASSAYLVCVYLYSYILSLFLICIIYWISCMKFSFCLSLDVIFSKKREDSGGEFWCFENFRERILCRSWANVMKVHCSITLLLKWDILKNWRKREKINIVRSDASQNFESKFLIRASFIKSILRSKLHFFPWRLIWMIFYKVT